MCLILFDVSQHTGFVSERIALIHQEMDKIVKGIGRNLGKYDYLFTGREFDNNRGKQLESLYRNLPGALKLAD